MDMETFSRKAHGRKCVTRLQEIINANKAGYVDLVMFMNDAKLSSIVKEHEGDLYHEWRGLQDEFESMLAAALIELLGNLTVINLLM